MLNNYLFYIILYLIFYVAYTYTYKLLANRMISSKSLIILINMISGIINIFLIPFFKMKLPTNIVVYLLLILSCVFYSINNLYQTKAIKGLQMSTWSMLKQVSNVILIFIGIVFLKEDFVLKKIIGALLIIFSNIIIFYKKDSTSEKKYVWYGFLASLFSAFATLIDAEVSGSFNIPFYSIFTFVVPCLMIVIFTNITFKDIIKEFKSSNKLILCIVCLTSVFAYLAKLYAYKIGEVTIVSPLCSLTVILNVIIGCIFLKEKDNMFQKAVASIILLIGILLIKLS